MSFEIYRPNPHPRTWRKYQEKSLETIVKAALIVIIPIPIALPAPFLWYFIPYRHGLHFDPVMTEYAIHYWLPTAGAFFFIIVALAVNFAWDKMKDLRKSVKCYDIVSFMHLRDEDVSPLVHCLAWFLALICSGGVALLPYPSAIWGMISTFASIYMPAFFTTIIVQMDHPLYGIWHMKHVHPEWLAIEPRAWRDMNRKKHMKDACAGFDITVVSETETVQEERAA